MTQEEDKQYWQSPQQGSDERLKKALLMLRLVHWAEINVSEHELRSVAAGLAEIENRVRQNLARTLSSILEEHMARSHRKHLDFGQPVTTFQANIVFLSPEAGRYIADTLEKQERRIAELELELTQARQPTD